MPTPYRAGAPGAVRAWPENPDEFNRIASLKPDPGATVVLRAGLSAVFLPEEGWEHYFSPPGLALGTVQTRAFTRWVTEGSISIPRELENTMLQASAGLLGGRVRVMVSPGLLVEINHMPDAGRSLNRGRRTRRPFTEWCSSRACATAALERGSVSTLAWARPAAAARIAAVARVARGPCGAGGRTPPKSRERPGSRARSGCCRSGDSSLRWRCRPGAGVPSARATRRWRCGRNRQRGR